MLQRGYYVIDTDAWIAQRVGTLRTDLTEPLRDFVRHDVFAHYQPAMGTSDRVLLWCAAVGLTVEDGTPAHHDSERHTRPVTVVLAVTLDNHAVAIVWTDQRAPTVYTDVTTDSDYWHSIEPVDIVCPAGHRFTWTGDDAVFAEHGEHSSVAALFGEAGPIVDCRDCTANQNSDTDTACHCGEPSAIYCPTCAQRCSLTLPDIARLDPEPVPPLAGVWCCPGCGTAISSDDADMVVDHVHDSPWSTAPANAWARGRDERTRRPRAGHRQPLHGRGRRPVGLAGRATHHRRLPLPLRLRSAGPRRWPLRPVRPHRRHLHLRPPIGTPSIAGRRHTSMMSDPTTTPVACARCATASTTLHRDPPWCQRCEIWLVLDPATGHWVSFAERGRRIQAAADAAAVAASAITVAEALPRLTALAPDGWSISTRQNLPAALHTITVAPPPSPMDVTAYIRPPDRGFGWYVRVHDRTHGIDYPLYEAGGVRAAYFTTAEDALRAAINAIRTDLT
jgi:hypothetical protein